LKPFLCERFVDAVTKLLREIPLLWPSCAGVLAVGSCFSFVNPSDGFSVFLVFNCWRVSSFFTLSFRGCVVAPSFFTGVTGGRRLPLRFFPPLDHFWCGPSYCRPFSCVWRVAGVWSAVALPCPPLLYAPLWPIENHCVPRSFLHTPRPVVNPSRELPSLLPSRILCVTFFSSPYVFRSHFSCCSWCFVSYSLFLRRV